jgi:hypothetical protein
VVASHYAEPLALTLTSAATLVAGPDLESEPLAELAAGTVMRVLDKSRGWAWGYAEGLVGYVPASALAPC